MINVTSPSFLPFVHVYPTTKSPQQQLHHYLASCTITEMEHCNTHNGKSCVNMLYIYIVQ